MWDATKFYRRRTRYGVRYLPQVQVERQGKYYVRMILNLEVVL